nr:hypothetical protein Iba_chr06aCG17440 [Ipomoea batatas]
MAASRRSSNAKIENEYQSEDQAFAYFIQIQNLLNHPTTAIFNEITKTRNRNHAQAVETVPAPASRVRKPPPFSRSSATAKRYLIGNQISYRNRQRAFEGWPMDTLISGPMREYARWSPEAQRGKDLKQWKGERKGQLGGWVA